MHPGKERSASEPPQAGRQAGGLFALVVGLHVKGTVAVAFFFVLGVLVHVVHATVAELGLAVLHILYVQAVVGGVRPAAYVRQLPAHRPHEAAFIVLFICCHPVVHLFVRHTHTARHIAKLKVLSTYVRRTTPHTSSMG